MICVAIASGCGIFLTGFVIGDICGWVRAMKFYGPMISNRSGVNE